MTNSKYPQVAVYQTAYQTSYVYLWTEGNTSRSEIKTLSTVTERVPLYVFDLGEEKPSVFTKYRDGYIKYDKEFEKTLDYANGPLKYKISGLNPQMDYLMSLTFYQDEDDRIWEEEVKIDGIKLKNIKLPRKKVVKEEFFIPSHLYSDSVCELSIRNISFHKSVLSGLSIFEFSKKNKNLLSSEKNYENPQKELFFSIQNLNKDKIKISYYLPKRGEVKIKIYSAIGMLLNTIKIIQSPGSHIFIWDSKDKNGKKLPKGVYFINIEFNNQIIKKGKVIIF